VAVCVVPESVAEIVTVVLAATALEVTANEPDTVWPAATETLDGTLAAPELEEESETVSPPVGAGPERVTVPVALATPPLTCAGVTATETRPGGVTVSVPVAEVAL